jgi:hypothetical protein
MQSMGRTLNYTYINSIYQIMRNEQERDNQ